MVIYWTHNGHAAVMQWPTVAMPLSFTGHTMVIYWPCDGHLLPCNGHRVAVPLSLTGHACSLQWPYSSYVAATQRPRSANTMTPPWPGIGHTRAVCCPYSARAVVPVPPNRPAAVVQQPRSSEPVSPRPGKRVRMSNTTTIRAAKAGRGEAAAKQSNYAKRPGFGSQGNSQSLCSPASNNIIVGFRGGGEGNF